MTDEIEKGENSPTMSIGETTDAMREAGFHISDAFLCAGIQQGAFPFAFGIQGIDGKSWRYFISRVKFAAWIREWSGGET